MTTESSTIIKLPLIQFTVNKSHPDHDTIVQALEEYQDEKNMTRDIWDLAKSDIQYVTRSMQQRIYYGAKYNCYMPVQNFCKIRFDLLTDVTILHQKVRNLEAFQFLDAPNLSMLKIGSRIRNIQSLAKCHFPQLQVLITSENPIHEMSSLSRGNFRKLTEFELDLPKKKIYTENYPFLFKMRAKKIRKLYMRKQQRIPLAQPMMNSLKKNNSNIYVLIMDDEIMSRFSD